MADSHGSRLAPDERRDLLIRKGIELLGQRDYTQMSVTELSQAAGISKGLLYHYFATKSEFVVEVLRQSRAELELRMRPTGATDPAARLDGGLDAFLGFAEEHAAGYLALTRARGGQDDAIRAELAEGRRRRVATLVELAADLGETDSAAIDTPALQSVLAAWLAFSEEMVVRWLTQRDLTREDVRHLLRQAFLANLASVAAVDRTPAADQLAAAAERAAAAVLIP